MHHVPHVLQGAGGGLIEVARTRHAVVRQIGRDDAQPTLHGELDDVAVVAGEGPFAVDDDQHLRIGIGARIFVHIADLPG